MYFSYDPSSFANLYPLYAEDVWDIIRMNREGIKPESLKGDSEPVAPEFVTAVGDDAINRFDEARRRKKKKKSRNAQKKAAPVAEVNASEPADNEGKAAEPGKEKQKKEHKGGNKGPKGGNRNGGGRRNDRPKKENI